MEEESITKNVIEYILKKTKEEKRDELIYTNDHYDNQTNGTIQNHNNHTQNGHSSIITDEVVGYQINGI